MNLVSALHLLAVWPWISYWISHLTCLILDFLICKMEMIIFFIIWLWNLNRRHKDQLSSCVASIQISSLSFYCVVLFSIFFCALVTYFKFSHLFCFHYFQNDLICMRYDWTQLAYPCLFSSLHLFSLKWDMFFSFGKILKVSHRSAEQLV